MRVGSRHNRTANAANLCYGRPTVLKETISEEIDQDANRQIVPWRSEFVVGYLILS